MGAGDRLLQCSSCVITGNRLCLHIGFESAIQLDHLTNDQLDLVSEILKGIK